MANQRMVSLFPKRNFAWLALGALAGGLGWWWLRARERETYDKQYTGPYPRYSGAVSAVTGGPPEDMNGMPATDDPDIKGPTYDGSRLSKPVWN